MGAEVGELHPYTETKVPTFAQIEDLRREPHSLSEYRGKVVVVNFWTSWCGPCIQEMPSLRMLYRELGGDRFEVLAINVKEKRYEVQKFSRLIDISFPVLLDPEGEVFTSWGGQVLPTSYVLDATGRIRYRVLGPLDWMTDEVLEKLRHLIAEPANPAATGLRPAQHKGAGKTISGIPAG